MTLPAKFADAAHLEEVMTTPGAALVADLGRDDGDIMVLGVGGGMEPMRSAACRPRILCPMTMNLFARICGAR